MSQILLNPRRPNFDESASTITFCTEAIICLCRLASMWLVVVTP